MENKEFEFISKIYIKGKSDKPIVRLVAKIAFIIFVALILFTIFMEGFSFDLVKQNAIPFILFIYVLNNTKGTEGYKSTIVKIDISDDRVDVIYDQLDRNDGMGIRCEKIHFSFDRITKIEYSNPLKCFNVQGYPLETISYSKNNREFTKDYLEKNHEIRTLIYVSDSEKEELFQTLEVKTGKNISILD